VYGAEKGPWFCEKTKTRGRKGKLRMGKQESLPRRRTNKNTPERGKRTPTATREKQRAYVENSRRTTADHTHFTYIFISAGPLNTQSQSSGSATARPPKCKIDRFLRLGSASFVPLFSFSWSVIIFLMGDNKPFVPSTNNSKTSKL
jgi:hypothetical protein